MQTPSYLDKQQVNLQTVVNSKFRIPYTTYDLRDLGQRKFVL